MSSIIDHFRSCFPVTKSDTEDIVNDPANHKGWKSVALRVDTGGTLKMTFVDDPDDKPVTWNVVDGELLPVKVKRVWENGTTAVVFGGQISKFT